MIKEKPFGRYRLKAYLLMLCLVIMIPGGIAAASEAPAAGIEVDANESTVSAGTTNPAAGQNFALLVTVMDNSAGHAPITGLTTADFALASFETGTSAATADPIVKKAVIETFPGVYTVTAQQRTTQPGLDIAVTVKGVTLSAKAANLVVSSGTVMSPCPAEASLRHYQVSALQENQNLPHAVYAFEKDRAAIEKGVMAPSPLILRAARGDCVEIKFSNRLSTPASMLIEHSKEVDGSQTVPPGNETVYRYFADHEGSVVIRDPNLAPDSSAQELYGAVVVEPEGSTFLHPQTGKLNPAGLEAIIQGPGSDDDFRERVSLFCEKGPDLEVNEEELVYQTVVNFPIATQKQRQVSLGISSYDPGQGVPPLGIFRSYVGDPVKFRVLNMNAERVVSFGIDDHQFPVTRAYAPNGYQRPVSDSIVAPLATLDAVLQSGAGGAQQQNGNYRWGNARLPYIQADEWGVLQVLSQPDATLLPLRDRILSGATIVPSTGTPVQNQTFTLDMMGAVSPSGELLQGGNHVTITAHEEADNTSTVVYDNEVVFTNGYAQVPVTLTHDGLHSLSVQINGAAATSAAIQVNVKPEDKSHAAVMVSTDTPVRNQPFSLLISDAVNAEGYQLTGNLTVEATSNNAGEGTNGLVYQGPAAFVSGAAQIPVTLSQSGGQTLTIRVAEVTQPFTTHVNVDPGAPVPDNSAASVTPLTATPVQNQSFVLDITEAKGITGAVLTGAINVQVVSSNPSEGANGMLLNSDVSFTNGSAQVPIQLAQTGAQTLTVQIAGVTTAKMVTVTVTTPPDYSSASVKSSTATPTQGQPFTLEITGAKGTAGTDLAGSINVQVSTDFGGNSVIVHNAAVAFVSGSAKVPVTLSGIGAQTLVVQIAGVTAAQSAAVNVSAPVDQSTATVIASTVKPVEKRSFNLQITGAKGFSGANLTGAVLVQVTSSDRGEGSNGVVYKSNPTFTNGTAVVPITLVRRGSQTLTIKIAGVTAAQTVQVEVIQQR